MQDPDRLIRKLIDADRITERVNDADRVICMSRVLETACLQSGVDAGKIIVLGNRVSTTRFQPAPQSNAHPGIIRLLFIGRLIPQKNVHGIAAALLLLKQQGWSVHLDVCGGVAMNDYLRRSLACLEPTEWTYWGSVPNRQLPARFHAVDLYVGPSLFEGFQIPLIEALACGKPCIAAHNPPASEIIDDGVGALVDPQDPRSIAGGIIAVKQRLNDPQTRTALSRACRRRAEELWSYKVISDRESQLYLEALSARAGTGPRADSVRSEVGTRTESRGDRSGGSNDQDQVSPFQRVRRALAWRGHAADLTDASSSGRRAAADRALEWLRRHELPTGGVRVHSQHSSPYAEVTGYIVPTLIARGEHDFARRLVDWLISVQRPDGSYADPDHGRSYIFDTGQVLRGLLAARDLVPSSLEAAERAATYLESQWLDGGRSGFRRQYQGSSVQETIQLYVLPPFREAAECLGRREWAEGARNCLEHYARHPEFLKTAHLTHFLAYELEALIDLGRSDLALPVLARLQRSQRPDGAVPAREGTGWVCIPGLAQLACCWFKIGMQEPARRALGWLVRHQRAGGGFFGSQGRAATYFPRVEPAWAVKYVLDADHLAAAAERDQDRRAA